MVVLAATSGGRSYMVMVVGLALAGIERACCGPSAEPAREADVGARGYVGWFARRGFDASRTMQPIQSASVCALSNSHSSRRTQSKGSEIRLCHGGLGGGGLTTSTLTLNDSGPSDA